MNTIEEQLKEIGLHHSESSVYLYLLENGLSSPPQISKGTGIARTNCYNLLISLKEKGLIDEHESRKRKVYVASDPESLLRSLDKKREATARLLPDLRALYVIQKNKPKIHFFDGFEQVKEIYSKSLNAKEIFALGSTKQISDLDSNFLQNYFNEIKKRGIFFHDILSEQSKDFTNNIAAPIVKGMYEYKFLPKQYGDAPTDILIWDDNVALINLHEPMFGTILTNQMLAETFKMIHKIIFERV